jgi:hypothetical protein
MARLARVVAIGVPHHVTQRGNGRQFILACDPDRSVYLDLLRRWPDASWREYLDAGESESKAAHCSHATLFPPEQLSPICHSGS